MMKIVEIANGKSYGEAIAEARKHGLHRPTMEDFLSLRQAGDPAAYDWTILFPIKFRPDQQGHMEIVTLYGTHQEGMQIAFFSAETRLGNVHKLAFIKK